MHLLHAAPGSCLGDTPNLRFGVLSDLHVQCVGGRFGGHPFRIDDNILEKSGIYQFCS